MKFETLTHSLPAYWASYLINGDDSGLSAEEKQEADDYLEKNNFPNFVDVGESYISRGNDATDLLCDTADYSELIKSENQIPLAFNS